MLERRKKYIFDETGLEFRQVNYPLKVRLLRFIFWFVVSLTVSSVYILVFKLIFGSPKEKYLATEIQKLKLSYSLLERRFEESYSMVEYLKKEDEMRYRPVLQMDSIPSMYRNPGFGGVDHYSQYNGLYNSDLIINAHRNLDLLKNMIKVQEESFSEIEERKDEWKRENEHLPKISPVDVSIPLGEGIKFREHHPVLGTARWHYGQDFLTPYGTEVYATGSGTVVAAGWNNEGFGYHVIIDHGYGFRTIYAHLSKIDVSVGLNVKRGDRIGLSGNSGISSGPHLHYQIDYNGKHQNPLWFFSNDLTSEEYREMIMTLNSKSKFRK